MNSGARLSQAGQRIEEMQFAETSRYNRERGAAQDTFAAQTTQYNQLKQHHQSEHAEQERYLLQNSRIDQNRRTHQEKQRAQDAQYALSARSDREMSMLEDKRSVCIELHRRAEREADKDHAERARYLAQNAYFERKKNGWSF